MLTSLVIALLAFLAGGVLAWLAAAARERVNAEEKVRQLDAARAAEASAAAELRKQLAALKTEIDQVRDQLQEERAARAAAQAALEKTQENLSEQRKLIEEAKTRLTEAFQALASQALRDTNQEFLKLAGENFQVLQQKAAGDLAQRQTAIAGLVDPLKISLNKFQEQISQVESSRQKAYGELTAQVQQLTESSQLLRQETGSLVTSLRQPQIKGKWGELLLRRAVELAGMAPHCDFTEQPSAETEEGRRQRPDMVVHLPGERQIVVDAKVPLHAFLKALGCRNQEEYHAAMAEHAQLVRTHMSELGSRRYWQQFSPSPEFVVLFLPAESYFSAALEKDHELIEDAMDKGVVLASPTTLLALLKAVAYGWNQQKTADDAQRIAEMGKDLHERVLTFLSHLNEVGAGLERANKAFNKVVASAEARLLPGARRFKDLAAPSGEEFPTIEPVETAPRQLVVPSPEDE